MKIFSKFPTVNISKLNFWLVICIAKNFIWTTLKVIFSVFRFFFIYLCQILSYSNKPYINGKLIYSAFRWCINLNFEKLTLMTGFVVQGHICALFWMMWIKVMWYTHTPLNPAGHEHWNALMRSSQLPLFSHGADSHSFTLTEQLSPVKQKSSGY